MKQLLKKIFFVNGVVLLIAVASLAPVAATSNTNISLPSKLSVGVNDLGYWIHSDCTYTATIPAAVNNWVWPGWTNPINLSPVSFNSSNVEFYETNLRNGFSGTTRFFLWGRTPVTFGQLYQSGFEYDFCSIDLNAYYLEAYSMNKRKVVCAHELGHVFGLDNINRSYSLMHDNDPGRTADGVTYDANQAVVNKYP